MQHMEEDHVDDPDAAQEVEGLVAWHRDSSISCVFAVNATLIIIVMRLALINHVDLVVSNPC